MRTVFEELTASLKDFLADKSSQFDEQAGSKALFFQDFTLNLILTHVMKFVSLKALVTELKTNESVKKLGFSPTPFSTLREGFLRFDAQFFQQAFQHLLANSSWLSIPAIDELGIFKLVDGSIFPNISSMTWATYKKTKNGIRLHMSFELNRMIPTEFIATATNHSERSFLLSIIQFENDPHAKTYRLVSFRVLDSDFVICTNREDLTTLEIIMLYAYRWQMELLFKFIKRTLNGVHLFNLSPNGVDIHFHTLMITALLELRLRQLSINFVQFTETIDQDDVTNVNKMEFFSTYQGHDPAIWIKTLTNKFYKYWKIGRHWLTKLRNLIAQPFDFQAITTLAEP